MGVESGQRIGEPRMLWLRCACPGTMPIILVSPDDLRSKHRQAGLSVIITGSVEIFHGNGRWDPQSDMEHYSNSSRDYM